MPEPCPPGQHREFREGRSFCWSDDILWENRNKKPPKPKAKTPTPKPKPKFKKLIA